MLYTAAYAHVFLVLKAFMRIQPQINSTLTLFKWCSHADCSVTVEESIWERETNESHTLHSTGISRAICIYWVRKIKAIIAFLTPVESHQMKWSRFSVCKNWHFLGPYGSKTPVGHILTAVQRSLNKDDITPTSSHATWIHNYFQTHVGELSHLQNHI